MKVRIVFENLTPSELDFRGINQTVFKAIVGDDGEPIDTFDGCWMADGDVEALELDVLPPLDKVTLTVKPISDKPLPEYKFDRPPTPDELSALMKAAYIRGATWQRNNPNSEAYLAKAAYDYVDKTLSNG